MDEKNVSRKELLAERKTRKQKKRKVKRREVMIPYVRNCVLIAVVIVLAAIWLGVDLHINRPFADENDTYPYIGKCVDVVKKSERSIVSYGRSVDSIEIRFEDGYCSAWSPETFSDSEIEHMIGSEVTLLMCDRADGSSAFPVGITHADGYEYYTLEEYNDEMMEIRVTYYSCLFIPIILLYIFCLCAWYPRRY